MARHDDDIERGAQILDMSAARRPLVLGALDVLDKTLDLYDNGMPPGASTGWRVVDPLYTVDLGQMTIITGWPSSGKSEWLDALCVNLAMHLGWKIIFHSPENRPIQIHISKLLRKLLHKPFKQGVTQRMTRPEVKDGSSDLHQMFKHIESKNDNSMSVDEVMRCATALLPSMSGSKVALVIDPWNQLQHTRLSHVSETEYIGDKLTKILNWSKNNDVHTFIVAHPQKVPRSNADGELPVPTPDLIAGSQNWWNKGDNLLTVWRDFKADDRAVYLYVQKVRHQHIGRIGRAKLIYDPVVGCYDDESHTPFNVRGPRL